MGLVRLGLHRFHVLHVGGDDHARHGPLGLRDSDRAVDQVADAGGLVDLLAEGGGDVAVELQQLDLLLEVAADRAHECLSDDRDDRPMVELRVIQAR